MATRAGLLGGVAAAGAVFALISLARTRARRGSAPAADSIEGQLAALYKSLPEVAGEADSLGIELDPKRYVELLSKLIGEVEHLQNFPPEFIPNETRVAKHVISELKPFLKENGGPLEVELIEYTKGRANLIIKYPGRSPSSKCVGLIGSHMDTVPAMAKDWERNPFCLTVEGDNLYGRGTTDCLGHVALITLFFAELAKKRPQLESNVIAVFIASEEATDKPGVGIDGLMKAGKLEQLKNGTCVWVDASDSEPCVGTAGALQWHLTAHSKRFHSGFPNKTVNPIELLAEALKEIQLRFYRDFPPHPEEKRYQFHNPTTIKPTQMNCAKGGLNQIPNTATYSGDVRLTPWYKAEDVVAKMNSYVEELNTTKFACLETRGPCSKYDLPSENLTGRLTLEFAHLKSGEELMQGVACDLSSPGFLAICDSIKSVRGSVKPYSICGSLPLVKEMKDSGFDLCITGFGLSSSYHAENEKCLLSDMVKAMKILSSYTSKMEAYNKSKSK